MRKVIRRFPKLDSLLYKEQVYLKLRNKEGRLLKDEIVRELPFISKNSEHFKEWKSRQHALKMLFKYLDEKKDNLTILDLGCGNGWMSAKIADRGFEVTGVDINSKELEQANRVFSSARLNFEYADILRNPPLESFDVIILASSIQYFPSITELIETLLTYLNPGGEILIMETHFYSKDEITKAKKRSLQYFNQMEAKEMASFYFHHTLASLESFNYKIIHQNTPSFFNKLLNPYKSIFPIITISGSSSV